MKRRENSGEKPLLEKLDALRAARGMTQGALERAAALPANKIAKWREGPGEPKLREGLRLAKALGVPIEFLADDEQREPVPGPDEDEVFLVKTIRELRISRNEAFKRLLAGGFGGPGFDPKEPDEPVTGPGDAKVAGERDRTSTWERESKPETPPDSPEEPKSDRERPQSPRPPRRPRR